MTDLPESPTTGEIDVVKVRREPTLSTKIARLFFSLAVMIAAAGIVFYAHDAYKTAQDNRNQGRCRAAYAAAVQVAEAKALTSLAIDSLSDQFSARVLAYEKAADAYRHNIDDCQLPGR